MHRDLLATLRAQGWSQQVLQEAAGRFDNQFAQIKAQITERTATLAQLQKLQGELAANLQQLAQEYRDAVAEGQTVPLNLPGPSVPGAPPGVRKSTGDKA